MQRLQNAPITRGARLGKAHRQKLAITIAQYTFITRARQHYEDWVNASFMRYHRRATNQLIKALKALA